MEGGMKDKRNGERKEGGDTGGKGVIKWRL